VSVEEGGGLRAYLGAYTISSFGRVAEKGGNILSHILFLKEKTTNYYYYYYYYY
jgi:hypothetical protein